MYTNTKIKKIGFILLPALLACVVMTGSTSTATAGGEPIYIIANNSFPTNSLSPTDVKRIFLKEQSRVKGKSVIPINAKKNSALRKAFANKILSMSASDEQSYWQKQKVQSGKQPPSELGNTMRAVFAVKGGLSYCFKSDYKPGVAKIIYKL